jgi:pimeloyl-ACP methyl ester carboxylesterase
MHHGVIRLVAVLLPALLAGGTAAMAAEREVSLQGQPAPLSGTLTMPDGAGPVPGVLMIGGSGPVDRNGNMPGMLNDSLRELAEGLAACGVASLRADKRGIGLSAAAGYDESELRLDSYVQDSVHWAAFLRAQPRIARVDLLGHSEGALIASIAAQSGGIDRLVLLEGAGRRVSDLLRAQLRGIDMAPVLRREAEAAITSLEHGEDVPEPPKGLAALFRESVQPYLISAFAHDPVVELSRTRIPALVVQGTTDLQVDVDDARRLARARPGVTLDVVEGMNHVLRAAPAGREANMATYVDPELPLMPGLVGRICAFLQR